MAFMYKMSNLLGTVYNKGNLLFTPDGNTVISPVGNRISLYDLRNDKSETLPIESRYNFTTLTLSPNGCILVAVNETGEALFCSMRSKTVMHKFHFRRHIRDIKFSPDGKHIAVTKENNLFLYQAPGSTNMQYNPLVLEKVYHFSYDETTCIDWTSDSKIVAVGGKDMAIKIYATRNYENFSVCTLGSHTDTIVGVFFEDNSLDMLTVSKNGQLCVWDCSIGLEDLIPKKAEDKIQEDADEENQTKAKEVEQEDSTSKTFYKRVARHFIKSELKNEGYVTVSAAAYHKKTRMLTIGFSNGIFHLYEMPDCNLVRDVLVSTQIISGIAFNTTGEWIAVGCAGIGRLAVWEWQSESYVFNQQGYFNNMKCLSYSPDGTYIATGNEDGTVKLWDTCSGRCIRTFSEHCSSITGIVFTQRGKALLSSSLDGSVRAFDVGSKLINFASFTAPHDAKLSCLCVDPSEEIICAGAQDSFEIFVWSFKTKRLLTILSGHEAPVSGISFSPLEGILVSTSWDKTVRIWDVFKSQGSREAITLLSGGLAIAFQPDGLGIAVATLDGQIIFFTLQTAEQTGCIEGRMDLYVGRRETDMITAKKLLKAQAFTSLCYTADGACILAAGRSKYICMYNVSEQLLVKKIEICCNLSFDAVQDFISRRKMTEFGNRALIEERQDEASVAIAVPGEKKLDNSSIIIKPEIEVSCIQFSPTGCAWAATSTEGLLVYSLNNNLMFDPFELSVDVTPQSIHKLLLDTEYSHAIMMALRLNEQEIILEVLEKVPVNCVENLCVRLSLEYVEKLLKFLASQLLNSNHIEFLTIWINHLLLNHGLKLRTRSPTINPILVALQKALEERITDISTVCDSNIYSAEFIINLRGSNKRKEAAEVPEDIILHEDDDIVDDDTVDEDEDISAGLPQSKNCKTEVSEEIIMHA